MTTIVLKEFPVFFPRAGFSRAQPRIFAGAKIRDTFHKTLEAVSTAQ
jgi:hypothetical protein